MSKTKNKLLLPEIAKIFISIEEITDEEIMLCRSILDFDENVRLKTYKKNMGNNLTNKREFLFICNLIDFKEINNNYETTNKGK